MFTTLMIVSTKQGLIYDEAESVKAYAVIEWLVGAIVSIAKLARRLRNGSLSASDPSPVSA